MKANIIMYLMMYFIQTMSTKFYLNEFEKMSHFFLTSQKRKKKISNSTNFTFKYKIAKIVLCKNAHHFTCK